MATSETTVLLMLARAVFDADATLGGCRGNSHPSCNCDIHAAHRLLREAWKAFEAGATPAMLRRVIYKEPFA
jgi:hypothetical protein